MFDRIKAKLNKSPVSEGSTNILVTQAASLTMLPLWYPLYARSLHQRAEILRSRAPGDLSHSTLFSRTRNYYRGISANMMLQPLFPYSEWLIQALLKKIERMNHKKPGLTEKYLASFFTGMTTALVTTPHEVTVLASQKYNEPPYKVFLRILKKSGPKAFYTGFLPMAVKNGSFVSGLFIATPALKQYFERTIPGTALPHTIATNVLSAGIPGVILTFKNIPFELAAVMRQNNEREKIATTLQALRHAIAKHGISALKAGALLRLCQSVVELSGFNLLKEEYGKSCSSRLRSL